MDKVLGWVLGFFDTLMDAIYALVALALSLLPTSPIQTAVLEMDDGPFRDIMSYINYFVPVGPMLVIMASYLTAVAIWYVVRWMLRIGKYIQ